MKLKISIGKCNYCGAIGVDINDYMALWCDCPGYSMTSKSEEVEIPDEILKRTNKLFEEDV